MIINRHAGMNEKKYLYINILNDLLNAANANGFDANFWKNVDRGFMSMIEMAPPDGSIL